MKRSALTVFTLMIIMALAPVPAMASGASGLLKSMEKPDRHNATLAKLIGNWQGKGKLRPARSWPKIKVKCSLSAKWTADGYILAQTINCKSLLKKISQTTYLGFDKSSGRIKGYASGDFLPGSASISGTGGKSAIELIMVINKDGRSKQSIMRMSFTGNGGMHSVMTKLSRRPYDIMDVNYSKL